MLQSSFKTITKLAQFQLGVSREALQLTKKLIKGSFEIAVEGSKDIKASFQKESDNSSELFSILKTGKESLKKGLKKNDILK